MFRHEVLHRSIVGVSLLSLQQSQDPRSYFESGGGGGGGGGLTSDSKWGGGGGLKTLFLSNFL